MLSITFPHITWPAKWTELFQKYETCIQDTRISLLAWNKPTDQWIKINTGGNALGYLGRLGAGGIWRDKSGQLLMAFATTLGEGTNNKVEIEAAIFGLTWALDLGYKNIILEMDSQLVVNWINQQATPQWNFIIQLGRLQNLIIQTQNFKCTHVYREANWVIDALSKHIDQTTNPQVYFSHQHLPKEARAYYQLDLMEMPCFRRKKTKKFKEPP